MTQPKKGLAPLRSIQTRLIVGFGLSFVAVVLLIELLRFGGLPFTGYRGAWGERRAEAFRSLDLVADMKKGRLQRWLEERRGDAHVFSNGAVLGEGVAALCSTARRLSARRSDGQAPWEELRQEPGSRAIVRYLREIVRAYEAYEEIQIADARTGTVLVSTQASSVGRDISAERYYTAALASDSSYVESMELEPQAAGPALYASHSTPVLHISHGIRSRHSESGEPGELHPVGVLVMRIDADEVIKPMLHTGEGLGRSGEALLVDQQGRILTSLKHPLADGSRAKPLEHRITARPAALGASGKEGLVDALDYRGEPVLAAYRFLHIAAGRAGQPDRGWALVVKRDKAELFAPLRREIRTTVALGLLGSLAFGGIVVVLARSLSRPIRELGGVAAKVAGGDMSARGSAASPDEVGLLAATLNEMLDRVENWHAELEEEVRSRTAELHRMNQKLSTEIGERSRVQKERENLISELEAKNAELERFTYTVSHDLKSPLVTIEGFVAMLEEDAASGNTEQLQSDVAHIESATCKMRQLLDELLALARIGRLVNPPEDVSLEAIARDAVSLVTGRIVKRGVEVAVASDLPTVYGDRVRLTEVLENLLDNAVKFMGDQPKPRVEIGARESADETLCYVRDNGLGIEPRYGEKVFELFDKLDRMSEGSGVGLAIAMRIVEVHGGRIWVESDGPGCGSTFYFTTPNRGRGRLARA